MEAPDELIKNGLQLYRAGKMIDAAEIFEAALSRDPTSTAAALNMGAACLAAKQYRRAFDAYHRVVQREPDNADGHYGLAMSKEASGNRKESLAIFEKAAHLSQFDGTKWLAFAEISIDKGKRINALHRAIDAAHQSLKMRGDNIDTLLQAGNIFFLTGAYGLAERAFAAITKLQPDHLFAKKRLTTCYYRQGRYVIAAHAGREQFLTASSKKWPQEHAPSNFTQDAKQSLLTLGDALRAAKLPFFLCAGTLLGCIRNGGPLKHDRDVDIGITGDVAISDVLEALRPYSAFSIPPYYDEDAICVPILLEGMGIDLFRYDHDTEHLWCGISQRPGDMKWRYANFSFKQMTFFGTEFLVPDPPTQYLEETYGSWAEPDHGFSSVLSSPARFDVSAEVVELYAYVRMTLAVKSSKTNLLKSLFRQAPAQIRQDREVFDAILALN